MIANLLTYKKTAIVIGLCLTAFTVQALRIKWLKSSNKSLEVETTRLEGEIQKAVTANQSNQITIAELQAANQQCVLDSEINEAHSKASEKLHQERIADITEKYNEKRKIKSTSVCGTTPINADDLNILQTRGSQGD